MRVAWLVNARKLLAVVTAMTLMNTDLRVGRRKVNQLRLRMRFATHHLEKHNLKVTCFIVLAGLG